MSWAPFLRIWQHPRWKLYFQKLCTNSDRIWGPVFKSYKCRCRVSEREIYKLCPQRSPVSVPIRLHSSVMPEGSWWWQQGHSLVLACGPRKARPLIEERRRRTLVWVVPVLTRGQSGKGDAPAWLLSGGGPQRVHGFLLYTTKWVWIRAHRRVRTDQLPRRGVCWQRGVKEGEMLSEQVSWWRPEWSWCLKTSSLCGEAIPHEGLLHKTQVCPKKGEIRKREWVSSELAFQESDLALCPRPWEHTQGREEDGAST